MAVFGRPGSIPTGVPQLLAPTPAPASLTGDNTAQVATFQTTVCFPRTTIFQAVAAPVFVPLVMGWFSALGTPTAKAALTAAVLASGGVLPPTQTAAVETVTVDKWFQNLGGPPQPRYTVSNSDAGFPAVAAQAAAETITVDKWFRELERPRADRARPVAAQQALAYVGFPPFAAGTSNEWFRPLDTPQKPRPAAVQQAPASTGFPLFAAGTSNEWFRPLETPTLAKSRIEGGAVYPALETARELRWLTPLSEPTRFIPRPRPEWTFTFTPAAAAETVTVDKWYQSLSPPRQPGYTVSNSDAGFPAVASVAAAETVTVDKWYQQFSRPSARARVALEGLFVLPPQETARGFEWYVPLNEPPKVTVRPRPEWKFPFAPAAPEGAVTLDKWYAPLSLPVRVRPRTSFYQFYVGPVAPAGPGTPTRNQKDGDPDYWKLPWFQVEGGTFAERLRTTALDSLYELSEAADAKAVSSAAKAVREYSKAAGLLLSDTEAAELGELARQLHQAASLKRDDLQQRVRDTRALLIAQALQQDEEEALIALGIY